ncbi:MAG: hypothetical protein ABI690_19540 [Chloroflexota bacterium]
MPTQSNDSQIAALLKEFLSQKGEQGGEGVMLYHPIFQRITQHTSSTILLSQMIFYYIANHCRPFYKFIRPCNHARYIAGDSWTETLCWSYAEFSTALGKIGTKVTANTSKTEARKTALSLYWTDSNKMTYFEVVLPNVVQAILNIMKPDLPDKSGIAIYLTKFENLLTRQVVDDTLPVLIDSSIESTQNNTEQAAPATQASEPVKNSENQKSGSDKYFDLEAYHSEHGFIGNLNGHPLVKLLLQYYCADDFSEDVKKKFLQAIPDDQGYNWPITKHFMYTPGYHNFAEEVVPQLADFTGNTLTRTLSFLQNFSKPGGTLLHWDLWRQENPWQLQLILEVQYAALKEGEVHRTSSTSSYTRSNGIVILSRSMALNKTW